MKKHNLVHIIFGIIVLLIVFIDLVFLDNFINDSFFIGLLIGIFWIGFAATSIEK